MASKNLVDLVKDIDITSILGKYVSLTDLASIGMGIYDQIEGKEGISDLGIAVIVGTTLVNYIGRNLNGKHQRIFFNNGILTIYDKLADWFVENHYTDAKPYAKIRRKPILILGTANTLNYFIGKGFSFLF